MTYPQPPGGQHPYGPHGPPGGGHDPSAQFPTHQYGGVPGGGYGAPPPKNKTGVVVAIVAVVVLVLGGLGITGFVAPGFFLSAQDGDTEPTTEPTSTEPSAPETAESTEITVDVPTVPTGPPTDGGTPTAGGQPVEQAALDAMQSFLDSVNAGDAAAAKSQLCAEAINTTAEVDELVGYQPALEIDPTMEGISAGDRSVQLYLRGTAKGQELEGYSTNLWVTSYDGPWCVHAFRVVVI
jgi:hypothetical protein